MTCSRSVHRGGQNRSLCAGLVIGMQDATTTVATEGQKRPPFCIEPVVRAEQIIDVVVQYLQQHPEQRHFVGAYIVKLALIKAFPCHR
jgi:hypothetical protein